MKNILYEITPLTKDKVFFSKFTPNDPMVFPIHFHEDYEITLVNNTKVVELLEIMLPNRWR